MRTVYDINFELAGLLVMAFLDFYSVTRYSRDTVQNRRFIDVSHSLTLSLITEILWILSVNFSISVYLEIVLNAVFYMATFFYYYCIVKYIASYTNAEKSIYQKWHYFNRTAAIISFVLMVFYVILRMIEMSWEVRLNKADYTAFILYLIVTAVFMTEAITLIFLYRKKFTKIQFVLYTVMFFTVALLPIMQSAYFPEIRLTGLYSVISVFVILIYIETPDEQELNAVLWNLNNLKSGLEQKVEEENERLHELDQKETKLIKQMMYVMSKTIDAKDKYTIGHSVRVAQYSKMLAEKMGLSKDEQDQIFTMGMLHDLGKVAVPNSIINKPGKLTDEEFAIIKSHPSKGYDILSKVKLLPNLADGARWHHERIDGRGYPDHLTGEEIPYLSRIICVADAYDAMTSYRSYRGVMAQDKVREQIVNGLGTQFDFEIGQKMIEIIDEDVNYELHEIRQEDIDRAEEAAS